MTGTVGDFLVERLYQWGVRRLFGYPGDGINGVFGALGRANGKIEFIIPVNADCGDIEVIFVEEHDDIINELGSKGVGEIGVVGVAAAVANAVYHATGKRVREFPITLDKVL